MGLLQRGDEWLRGKLGASESVRVLYSRGPQTITATAIVGETTFTLDSQYGIQETESRDYIIAASELCGLAPKEGDVITETTGAGIKRFSVWSPQGVPVFSYSNRAQTVFRIHTRIITSTLES